MKLEEIPQNGWIYGLANGDPLIEDHVKDILHTASGTTDFRQDIISKMTEIMTECAQVIQHANAMKDDRICTCKEKRGGKP